MKTLYIICSLIFLIYLALPNINYPEKIKESIQSKEPADTENILRRAYFTNYGRSEVINHYMNEYKLLGIFSSIRLNYPPEEAQVMIRDQTMSTYLEELVYPFRESIYINGFEPKNMQDTIIIDGVNWQQKIIIKQVTSNVVLRFIIGSSVVFLGYRIYNQFIYITKRSYSILRSIRKKENGR